MHVEMVQPAVGESLPDSEFMKAVNLEHRHLQLNLPTAICGVLFRFFRVVQREARWKMFGMIARILKYKLSI